jgi:hypothetical protein
MMTIPDHTMRAWRQSRELHRRNDEHEQDRPQQAKTAGLSDPAIRRRASFLSICREPRRRDSRGIICVTLAN